MLILQTSLKIVFSQDDGNVISIFFILSFSILKPYFHNNRSDCPNK